MNNKTSFQEFWEAHKKLQIARQNFDNAEHDYVDIAIKQLLAAEIHFDSVIEKLKKEEVNLRNVNIRIS